MFCFWVQVYYLWNLLVFNLSINLWLYHWMQKESPLGIPTQSAHPGTIISRLFLQCLTLFEGNLPLESVMYSFGTTCLIHNSHVCFCNCLKVLEMAKNIPVFWLFLQFATLALAYILEDDSIWGSSCIHLQLIINWIPLIYQRFLICCNENLCSA